MFKIFKNINDIAEQVGELLFDLSSLTDNTPINIALSGGNTPIAIFKYLNETYGNKLADNRFHFWWVDERCVPSDNDESNYKMAHELWLHPIGISATNIHAIIGVNEPEKEAIRYSEEMKKWIVQKNGLPRFDLILLGLGEDGHIASIFPNQMKLISSENWCQTATHPVTVQKRITLTGKVLNNAKKVVFILSGLNKAQIVKAIVEDKKTGYPASFIKPLEGELIWLLDEGAASDIYLKKLK